MSGRRVITLPSGVVLERLRAGGPRATGRVVHDPGPPQLEAAISGHAGAAPHRAAIVTPEARVSFAEFMALSAALEAEFPPDGAAPVLVLAPLGIVQPVALLACLRRGRPFVGLDPHLGPLRLRQILGQTGCDVLVHAAQVTLPSGIAESGKLRLIDFDSLLPSPAIGHAEPAAQATADPQSPAFLVFTSGSTGVPKGVVHTRASLQANLQTQFEIMDVRAGDRLACVTTPSALGLPLIAANGLVTGATLLLTPDRLAIGTMIELLETHRATHLSCYVGFARALSAHPRARAAFAAMRAVQVYGDSVSDADCAALHSVLPPTAALWLIYGSTENPMIAGWRSDSAVASENGRRPLGHAVQGAELWLDRSAGGDGGPAAGELYVASARLAQGYWRDQSATRENFIAVPELATPFNRTGDLVRQRGDLMLQYAGRIDNLVKMRGWRIEIEDIEAVARGIEGVENAGVVPRRDAQGTVKSLALHVALASGWQFDPLLLAQRLGEALPPHMIPTSILAASGLPLNAAGKIDRLRLAEIDRQVQDRREPLPAAGSADWPDPLAARIAAIVAAELGVAAIAPGHVLHEIGGDSLQAVNMALRIEKQFAVEVEPERLLGSETLGEIVAAIAADARRA